jgi:hypothetical protein
MTKRDEFLEQVNLMGSINAVWNTRFNVIRMYDEVEAALCAATARAESAEAERNELRQLQSAFSEINVDYFELGCQLAAANERARLAEAVCELDALDMNISFAEWCHKHNAALAAWRAEKDPHSV